MCFIYLTHKYKVTSRFGSILDSVSDDLTIAMAIIGITLVDLEFLRKDFLLLAVLLAIFITQIALVTIIPK